MRTDLTPKTGRRRAIATGLETVMDLAAESRAALHGRAPADPPQPAPDVDLSVPLADGDFFATFGSAHTLLAEIRPLLAEEAARHGIDTEGRSDLDVARAIFALAQPKPTTERPAHARADSTGPASTPPAGDQA